MNNKLIISIFSLLLVLSLFTGCMIGEKGKDTVNHSNDSEDHEENLNTTEEPGTEETQENKSGAKEVFLSSLEKQKELGEYEMDCEMRLEINKEDTQIKTSEDVWIIGEGVGKIRVDLYKDNEDTRRYYLSEGGYRCQKYTGADWKCFKEEEGRDSLLMDQDKLKELIEEEGITFQGVRKEQFAGRECNYVEMNINPVEYNQVMEEGISYQIDSMEMEACYDEETGLNTYSKFRIVSDNTLVEVEVESEDVNVDTDIPEDSFELPAEPLSKYENNTYEDLVRGFSVKYPEEWEVEDSLGRGSRRMIMFKGPFDGSGYPNINVVSGYSGESDLEKSFEEGKKSIEHNMYYSSSMSDYKVLEEGEMQVNGEKALYIKQEFIMEGIKVNQKQVYLIHGNYLYLITCSAPEETYSSYEDEFNETISSLSFEETGGGSISPLTVI